MTVPEAAPRVSVVVFLHVGHGKVRETLSSLGRQARFEEIEVISHFKLAKSCCLR